MRPREFFRENGYFHARGLFSPSEIAELVRDYDRIAAQLVRSGEENDATWNGGATAELSRPDDTILHTHNVQRYSARWLQAFQSPKFLDQVEEFLGEDIILHHSKLFQKPPEKGSPFPIHQDWTYFPCERNSMIAGIVHLTDADDEMGCLRVVPGSHRLGRVTGSGGREPCAALDAYPLESATPVEAKAGDVVFFHYFTLHGSLPNRSQRTRKTVLVQLYSGSDRIEDGNTHPDERLVLRGWNHRATRSLAGAQQ